MPCNVFKNKCQLCGGTAERKKYFFSDTGKSLELKRIVFKLCEIVVSESDELPKYCCEKLTHLNTNIEAFASTCKAAQKVLEGDLIASRQSICQKRYRSGNTPTSTEKPQKLPCHMVNASVRKNLLYDQQQSDTSTSFTLQEKEASRNFFYIQMLLSATKLNLLVFFLLYQNLNMVSTSSLKKSRISMPVKLSILYKAPVLLNSKVISLYIFEISAGL